MAQRVHQGLGMPGMAGLGGSSPSKHPEPKLEEEEDPASAEDAQFMKMTPMELDLQLQCAELIFRSILEGKRLAVHPSEDLEEWEQDILGEAWVQQNKRQRAMIAKATFAKGENTPEWMEALSDMGDLAWEVFESTNSGEVLRRKKDVDRTEVLELLKDLYPKVRDSHFARCGAGDRLYGFRACIGVYRLFSDDPEVLDACADVIKWAVLGVEYNRDGVAELSLPLPPEDRRAEQPERGWAFLRAALDAYMVQLGEQHWSWRPEDSNHRDFSDSECSSEEDSAGSEAEQEDLVDRVPRLSVAVKIAESILAVRQAPALVVQLKLLREPPQETACLERKELSEMLPAVVAKTEEVLAHNPSEVLSELLDLLQLAGSRVQEVFDGEEGGSSGSSGKKEEAGVLKGMLGGMRGLLGRGSST